MVRRLLSHQDIGSEFLSESQGNTARPRSLGFRNVTVQIHVHVCVCREDVTCDESGSSQGIGIEMLELKLFRNIALGQINVN